MKRGERRGNRGERQGSDVAASGTHYVTLGSGPYWWRFVSRTADKKHANTDDTFYFTIYGRDGREDKFELDGDWDDREKGNLEYYTLKSNIPFWAATGWICGDFSPCWPFLPSRLS